jgi:hypothetical protein
MKPQLYKLLPLTLNNINNNMDMNSSTVAHEEISARPLEEGLSPK